MIDGLLLWAPVFVLNKTHGERLHQYGRAALLDYPKRRTRGAADPRVSWSGRLRIPPEDVRHTPINPGPGGAPAVQVAGEQLSVGAVVGPPASFY